MNDRSDEKLVIASRAGDKEAYAQLVRRHYKRVFAVCVGMLGNVHDAEDIAQDALLSGFVRIKKLRNPSRFGPWITKTARNLCINFVRRKQLGRKIIADTAAQTHRPDPPQPDHDNLLQAIARLPADTRLPLMMYHLDSRSVKAIAQELKISPSGVYQKLRAGIEQLHDLLTEQGESK